MTKIEFPDKSGIYSPDFVLTPEAIAAATELLLAGLELARKEKEFLKFTPPNSNFCFYGDWSWLKIWKLNENNQENYE